MKFLELELLWWWWYSFLPCLLHSFIERRLFDGRLWIFTLIFYIELLLRVQLSRNSFPCEHLPKIKIFFIQTNPNNKERRAPTRQHGLSVLDNCSFLLFLFFSGNSLDQGRKAWWVWLLTLPRYPHFDEGSSQL